MAEFCADWLRQIRRKMTRWYDANHRKLPWRETSDPYAIWISETMLQQTQVATVVDYYHRFLLRFPDVGSLAAADEESVLRLWAGLGYYRRARQLHAAAKKIVVEFDGEFPQRFDDVHSLPGIGRYTAGAITSFAFDTRSPIVEANTARLFSRLMALREPTQSTAGQKELWQFAEAILPSRKGAGRVNQSAIELGSQLCRPANPDCQSCPLQCLCPTFADGLEAEIPVPPPKKSVTAQTHVCFLIAKDGKYLLRRNQAGEWWEGLWDFPRASLDGIPSSNRFKHKDPDAAINFQIAQAAIGQIHSLRCQPIRHARTIRHSVTRFRISLFCFEAELTDEASHALVSGKHNGQWKWCSPSTRLPLTASAERLRVWANKRVSV